MGRLPSIADFAIVALTAFAHAQDREGCLDSAGLIASFSVVFCWESIGLNSRGRT
ncbi:hypothetical protein LY76DRAFT_591165 [Colletotrichum caudatum]|nr:hypothetical protein LY76DRAFT_591165 [Colletotrichum caudatum]